MKMENEFWFCDTSNGLEYTIGQFIDFIESHNDWHDSEKSSYALCHLKGPAKKFSEENLKPEMDWKKINIYFVVEILRGAFFPHHTVIMLTENQSI